MPVTIDTSLCVGCGACTAVCPTESLSLGEEGFAVCNEETCIDCYACVGTCPCEAISE
ncbi:MAG: 4Fe-4S binding protein [Erysipelotrichaceae bacterium]|nr:4Fe-4S binding protein [Erysipelotrichaceae bacterium]